MRISIVIGIILACMVALWCHGATTTNIPANALNNELNLAIPDRIIIVEDGTYTGSVNVRTNDVTVRALNKWGVSVVGQFAVYPVGGTHPLTNCVIDGFKINNASATAVYVIPSSSGVTIRNCWIHDSGTSGGDSAGGIEAHDSESTTIEYCLIENCGHTTQGQGAYLNGTSNLVRSCVIRNGAGFGIQMYSSGGGGNPGGQIYNNLVYGNHAGALALGALTGEHIGIFNNTLLQSPGANLLYKGTEAYQDGTFDFTNNVLIYTSLTNDTTHNTTSFGINYTNSTVGNNSELVQNPGFESGIFSPWTAPDTGSSVLFGNTNYVHSGTYGAEIGPGTLKFLRQTLTTDAGATYQVSFWLHCDGLTPNIFQFIFGGTTYLSLTDASFVGWTNVVMTVPATSTSTELRFGFQNTPSYFGFDDISVRQLGPFQFVDATKGIYWLSAASPIRSVVPDPYVPLTNDFWGNTQLSVFNVGAFPYGYYYGTDTRTLDPSGANPDYWHQKTITLDFNSFDFTGGNYAVAYISLGPPGFLILQVTPAYPWAEFIPVQGGGTIVAPGVVKLKNEYSYTGFGFSVQMFPSAAYYGSSNLQLGVEDVAYRVHNVPIPWIERIGSIYFRSPARIGNSRM